MLSSTIAQAIGAPVLVLREQEVNGADSVGEYLAYLDTFGQVEAPAGTVGTYTAQEAFERTYEHDAHFVQYALFENENDADRPAQRWCRINKVVAPLMEREGVFVKTTLVGVDLDTNPHAAWAAEGEPSQKSHVEHFTEATVTDPILSQWWAFYLTSRGARVVYRVAEPVLYSLVEPHIAGLLTRLEKAGIDGRPGRFSVDWRCAEWNRVFRLPRVVRAGKNLHDTEVCFHPDARLDLKAVPPGTKPASIATRPYEGTMPAEDVTVDFEKGGLWYEWKKVACRVMAQTEAGLVARGIKKLVDGDGSAPSGRNDAILRHATSAIAQLYPLLKDKENAVKQQTSPEGIFGLFLPAVQQFAQDPDTHKTWPQILWDIVTRYWSKEEAKHQEKKEKFEAVKAVQQVEAATVTDSVIFGVMRWSSDHTLLNGASTSAKMEIIKRGLLLAPGGGQYYVLRKDGYYRPDSVGKDVLIATMRQEGLGSLIDLDRIDEDGKRSELDEPTVLRRHAMAISCIEGAVETPELPGGRLVVTGSDTRLIIPIFGLRKDIEPEFNGYVDDWLRSFGTEKLIEYVQKALNFKEPVPLLGLIGPPSIGKQLLLRGFAETITTRSYSTERDLGRFGYQVMRTPFMSINEDVEDMIRGNEISSLIRRITAGDSIDVERKYKAPVTVNVPQRIIATANNDDVVLKLLGASKDLTPHDRVSLRMRTVFLRVEDGPAKYLEKLGGQKFTGRDGARWVRGVDGAESNDIVAKHFLWIHQQNKYPPHQVGRFLMEGYLPPDLMHALSARTPHSSLVVKTLLTMVEAATKMQTMYGLVIAPEGHKDRIFVAAHEVVKFYEKQLAEQTRKPLTENLVGKALKGLRAPGTDNDPRFVVGRRDRKNRWTEVLLTTLLTEAGEYGYKSDNLTKLAREAGIVVEGEALAVA